nr:uncharacterized protein CFP56_57744 [Quercus suber]
MSAPFLSREEEAELAWSNKKVKDISHADFDSQMNEGQASFSPRQGVTRHPLSFRDKLVGEIPGAKSQAFNFTEILDAEEESDSEMSELRDGLLAIKFTKEQKCRFRSDQDFKPSEANISSVALWIKLNELPIEYYNSEALQIIGNTIGRVLRIDMHTANESRRRFARPCIQVDIEKPLNTTILIGGKEHAISYEGIQNLCFSCERLGHRRESCLYAVRKDQLRGREVVADPTEQGNREGNMHVMDNSGTRPSTSKGAVQCEAASKNKGRCEGMLEDTSHDLYGPWVVVAWKCSGNKATKKGVPTDQHPIKNMGLPIYGISDSLKWEGKRKGSGDCNLNGAHIQKVVQSISKGNKETSQRSGRESNGPTRQEPNFGPSVKGKKGIARGRVSLSLAKDVAVSPLLSENALPENHSFLNNCGFNPDQAFKFNSSAGQAHQGASCYLIQKNMEAQSPRSNELSKAVGMVGESAQITTKLKGVGELADERKALDVPEMETL